MFKVQCKRVWYLGLLGVVRNAFVSFSVIFVVTVALFIVGLSILFGQLMNDVTQELRDKVDVTVYFVPEATEVQIFDFRDKLAELSNVKEVIYISRTATLEEYRKRHESDPDVLRGLDILDENPFRARLSIRADHASDFESITRFIENEDLFSDNSFTVVDNIDYYQNRDVIERLSSVIETSRFFSRLIIALLVFISFLIVFNIIRLIIYISHEEIRVMRLIGAADWYVRAPFLVSGAMYGLVGSVAATVLLYPVAYWISPSVAAFFGGRGLVSYYISEFFYLIGVLVLIGVTVSTISSYFSTRRYLDE